MNSMPAFFPRLQVLFFSPEKKPPRTPFSWVFWSCPVPAATRVNSQPCAPLCDALLPIRSHTQPLSAWPVAHKSVLVQSGRGWGVSASWAHRETEALEWH